MVGALAYVGLTFLLSPKDAILIQLFVPLSMLVAYLFILGKPRNILSMEKDNSNLTNSHVEDSPPYSEVDHTVAEDKPLSAEQQPWDDVAKPLMDEIVGEDSKPLLEEMEDKIHSKWSKLKLSRLKLSLFNREEIGLRHASFVTMFLKCFSVYTSLHVKNGWLLNPL